jgi:hypothetical protein
LKLNTAQQTFSQKREVTSKPYYEGPVKYRGQDINWKYSISRVTKTLRRGLERSQFASLNMIGIPGSGKSVGAGNIVTDIIEKESKEKGREYNLYWMGADDLRNLEQVIDNLPKYQNNIVVFDDVSKALEQLSKSEQSELFASLTTTRHTTQGRLLFVNLYHYTFSDLKEIRAQGVVIIYTSVTLAEYGNLSAMLPGKSGQKVLQSFSRLYESAFMNGFFMLRTHDKAKEKIKYEEDKPFRICLVVNLFKPHLALFMKLDNGYQAPADTEKVTVPNKKVIEQVQKAYGHNGLQALKWMCLLKGHKLSSGRDAIRAWQYVQKKIQGVYTINYRTLDLELAGPDAKKTYRDLKNQKEMMAELKEEMSEGTKELIDANSLGPI